MTAVLEVSDNAGLHRTLRIQFTNEKQAQAFMDQYENIGGARTFNCTLVSIDAKRSIHNLTCSHNLFLLVYAVLYNDYRMYAKQPTGDEDKYTWVNAIWGNGKGRYLLSDRFEYPTRQAIYGT